VSATVNIKYWKTKGQRIPTVCLHFICVSCLQTCRAVYVFIPTKKQWQYEQRSPKLNTGVPIYENLCMQDQVNPGLDL